MSDRFEAYETAQERMHETMLRDPARIVRHASTAALHDDINRRLADLRALIDTIPGEGWRATHRTLSLRGCDTLRETIAEAFGG